MRKQEGTSILSLHPGAKAGCSIGGKCEKCPLYRFVETEHPQTGEQVREWDCIFVWQVMWTGDTSRQTRGVHAAVAQQTNTHAKAHGQFLSIVEAAVTAGSENKRLANASVKD